MLRMDRRGFIAAIALAGLADRSWSYIWDALPAYAQGQAPQPGAQAAPAEVKPFSADTVRQLAEKLAKTDFVKPSAELAPPFDKLSYDQYRDIRFKTDRATWRGERIDYELQLFPLGSLYNVPVEINLVQAGAVHPLKPDADLFTFGPMLARPAADTNFGFSGFRVHGPINRPDYFDEFLVFQGASYFRAVGRGNQYGMSARGLAINTARPGGEEFPLFRTFWIERPAAGATEIVVHALLDSPSTSGAYRFAISPGLPTTMDVTLTLFPRKELSYIGLAPLTSMFLFGPNSRRVSNDFRQAVHDSEGLAILNGNGERLWRPLQNPKKLQLSSFLDRDCKGFGLVQRDRSFDAFEDLEAHYEKRPTVWVEPKGGWGEGAVELIEIPTEEEIHDNIVAYWRPAKPLPASKPYSVAYRLSWGDVVPQDWGGAKVHKTWIGGGSKPGTVRIVIDWVGPVLASSKDLPAAEVSTSTGTISEPVVQFHPYIRGVRVTFDLAPGSAEAAELRLGLRTAEKRISEVWLYRWTKP